MAEQIGTYYRQTGVHDFCGCEILPPPKYEIGRIIIDHVEFHKEIKINGQKKQNAFVAYFAPNPYTTLPFCLNSGNAKKLAKRTWNIIVEDGTECQGRIDLIHNIPVRLCRELTRDPSDGGQIYGLRISKIDPDPEPTAQKKVISADQIPAIVDWARKKGKSLKDISDLYDFADDAVRDTIEGELSGIKEDLPE